MRQVFVNTFYFIAALWLLVASGGRVLIALSTGARLDALPFVSAFIGVSMLVLYAVIPKGKSPNL